MTNMNEHGKGRVPSGFAADIPTDLADAVVEGGAFSLRG